MAILDWFKEIPLSTVLKEKLTDLEKENGTLKKQVSDLQAENKALNLKLEDSEQQRRALEEQIIKINHGEPLKFDQATGTWIDESSGMRYCPSCKIKGMMAPLIKNEGYWRCSLKECRSTYDNPDTLIQRESWRPIDPTMGY